MKKVTRMKKLKVKLLEDYKLYRKNCEYVLDGDLILLSGINGSGKSQLLKIIANNLNKKIARNVHQSSNDEDFVSIENIIMLSFRDNIDLGNDFGSYSINVKLSNSDLAWKFYIQRIRYKEQVPWNNADLKRSFYNGDLLFNNGGKNPAWRSILEIITLLKENYQEDKLFTLSEEEFKRLIPNNFIWRNENDIINQVGNLFYLACCDRANQQIECSKTGKIFDNSTWLQSAPWTILNKLFSELNFKYRFKDDYLFDTPEMEENPKLRLNSDIRNLNDLSDGEKAILKLALISLDEEISKDIKLVLFDEYDAPLNPSLIEAFYHVIEKFYIYKGIQIIMTTHSPATISLAPGYAKFYEMFSQQNNSPKILEVDQFDYAELKEANKAFYSKIQQQEERIIELEKTAEMNKNALLVEDRYCQLYKIAYLKLKGLNGITEENLETMFQENADFTIDGNFSSGGLYNVLNSGNTSLGGKYKRICLFDFDNEGYAKFEKIKSLKLDKNNKIYSEISNDLNSGLILKHNACNRYAMMLPIPNRLLDYVSTDTSNYCFVEIETLLDEEFLKNNSKAKRGEKAIQIYKIKDSDKSIFWKDLLNADKSVFKDFEPLFSTVENIFKSKD